MYPESWTLNEWIQECHGNSKAHGFHDPGTNDTLPPQIANIHGEVSECWEEIRKPDFDPQRTYFGSEKKCEAVGCVDGSNTRGPVGLCNACVGLGKVSKPEGLPSELADIVIRVFDLAGAWKIDLLQAMATKHRYNISRPFRHGGKRS